MTTVTEQSQIGLVAKPAHTPLRPVSQEKRLTASKEAVSAKEQKEREELFRKLDEARSRNAKKVIISRWRSQLIFCVFLYVIFSAA